MSYTSATPAQAAQVGKRYTLQQAQRAALLIEWLVCKRLTTLTPRQVMQYGPSAIRRAAAAKDALATLADHGYLHTRDGRVYEVDPTVTST